MTQENNEPLELEEGAYFEVYQGQTDGKWYWRLKAGNHKTIADGSEGYDSGGNAVRAVNRLIQILAQPGIRIGASLAKR